MARSDYAALLTEPAAEYLAHSELQRFGIVPYMPQLKKPHHTHPGSYVMRHYPLFSRYILLKFNDAHDPSIRLARGVTRYRPILADALGRPWRAPEKVIDALRESEARGLFDQILHKNDTVTLAYGVLSCVRSVLTSEINADVVQLLTPLFGGCRATVRSDKLIHAA